MQNQIRRTHNVLKELVDLVEIAILMFIYAVGLIIVFTSDVKKSKAEPAREHYN